MIRLNAINLLKEKGKTKYWLYKQMGMSYQNFNKMINNETKSIRYENLEAMYYILECNIEDLLIFAED
ncbi:MAG: helix-turn-helix transcriptional regulator [Ruminococcaceae bacterium]|nr:helix-turn-helix transcriptional regulator [Oscillospiraceae bacterium]